MTMTDGPREIRYARPSRAPAALFVLLVLGALAFLAWKVYVPRHGALHDAEATARPVLARGDLAADEQATIELYRRANPSVVFVENRSIVNRFTLDPLEVVRGTASGFIWDDKGYVVTNHHVVARGDRFRVILFDHSSWEARLVGSEPDKDVAVLKVDERALPRMHPISVGVSSDLQVGQKAFAIGNPFGLDQTLTTGVVSALGREISQDSGRKITGVIQTDAAINPGNSGGPLLDSAGRLIGMNTAIYSPSGASAGIGFAVPVDAINDVVPRLIRGEETAPTRAGLGVSLMPDQVLDSAGIEGVLLENVPEDSAAGRAGLRATQRDPESGDVVGDLIVAVNGKPVRKTKDLRALLGEHRVGDRVTVTVRRGQRRVDVDVTLQPIRSS